MSSTNNKMEPSPDNKNLFLGISRLIEQSRKEVYAIVNSEITLLYWQIGKYINEYLKTNNTVDYGKKILQTVSAKLSSIKSLNFINNNLKTEVKMYSLFPINQNLLNLFGNE